MYVEHGVVIFPVRAKADPLLAPQKIANGRNNIMVDASNCTKDVSRVESQDLTNCLGFSL